MGTDAATPGHMSPDEFRRQGHATIDAIADYWQALQSPGAPPVLSRARPGDVLAALPARAPEHPEPFDDVLADIARVVMPGLTHWQHPSFFAYFPSNGSGPAVLGDLLSTGLGIQGMLWATSPACTELETRVTDWMAHALGLPRSFIAEPDASSVSPGGGVIQGTASESTLVAMLAARHRLRRSDTRAVPVVYCSHQAHSSVVKAAMIAGITEEDGTARVRQIATLPDWSIDAGALREQMRRDLASGLRPAMVCATLGTTGVMAFDDLAAVAGAIETAGSPHPVWLHADAAMGGAAFICPELRGPLAGADRLDSLCFNPHKWLLTSFDCGLFWTRDSEALTGALSVTPEYLRNAASNAGAVTDYRDWQVPLGRRFRSLKLWCVLRHYGLEGLRTHVRNHLKLAEWLESQVHASDRFELAAPRPACSPLVCLRLRGDASTPELAGALNGRARSLLEGLNASGSAYFSHTTLPDTERPGNPPVYIIRVSIGGTFTARPHVEQAWRLLCDTPV
ncbi:MAG: pyridoxal-dependent decarboxylase [Phycisphaerales bacterium]|nr:pyridoxal-dependent decarboxylase [Phycisphaerales bacterium]